MATFSQQFLANLGGAGGMLQGFSDLGGAIGGVPGQMKEKRFQTELAGIDTTTLAGQIKAQEKLLGRETDPRVVLQLQSEIRRLRNEQRELEQFGQLSALTEEGMKASQAGDLVVLDAIIAELRGMLDAPGVGIDQKRSINSQINNLIEQRVGAKEINVDNETKELINLNNKIKDPTLPDSEKVKHQARIDTIRQNPTVVEKYQKFQMGKHQFEEKQQEIKAKQWLDNNVATINAFIADGDDKGLEDFIQNAGEYTDDAQAFATKALEYKESIIKFQVQNANASRKPNVELYQKEIDLLPDELKEDLGPAFNAYKEAAKKWNPKTETWEGGAASRSNASGFEKALQQRITAAQTTAAKAAFNDNRSEKNLIKKLILEAKLNLDAADTLTNQDRTAARLSVNARYQGVKRTSTIQEKIEAEVAEKEKEIVQDKIRAATEGLDYLQNIGKEKPVDDGDKGEPQSNEDIILEAMKDNPRRKRKEVIKQLIAIGALPSSFKEKEEEEERETREERMIRENFPRGFVERMEKLGTREERMARLGTREERMSDFRERRAE